MFRKILVANRGEIAIRAFRAGYELGAGTVAVFPYEDRNSLHRLKADESYEIGEPGHPVRAYLSVEEIIKAARKAGADVDELLAAAEEIGFPIFVKAVAGGGGRGMRRVDRPEALRDALEAAMREAESAFGDPTVFLEKAVVNPRHIEVQILADA